MKSKHNHNNAEESILHELRQVGLSSNDISVSVDESVVTLNGFVDTFGDKILAENAAIRVGGVGGVANEIKVREFVERTDPDIVRDIIDVFKKDVRVPDSEIKAIVRDGWLTLQGCVESHHQKDAAEDALKYIGGVRGISNRISIHQKNHVNA